MRKVPILLALGVVGLPSLAMAANVVTMECHIVTNDKQIVGFIEPSLNVSLPLNTCKVGTSNCSNCIADLLSNGWNLTNSFGVASGDSYFVLTKGTSAAVQ